MVYSAQEDACGVHVYSLSFHAKGLSIVGVGVGVGVRQGSRTGLQFSSKYSCPLGGELREF